MEDLKKVMGGKIKPLTGIRFFAAMSVLAFHYGAGFSDRAGFPSFVVTFLRNGYMGVSLFFVLSGFILTFNYSDRQWAGSDWRKYITARLARIYPVYVLALVLALPILSNSLSFAEMMRVLLMIQSWGGIESNDGYLWVMQAWTLSVEFFFYLMFPIALFFLKKMRAEVIALFVVILFALIHFYGTSSIAPGTAHVDASSVAWALPLPMVRFPEFLLGMLICRLAADYYFRMISFSNGYYLGLNVALILMLMATASTRLAVASVTILFCVLILQLCCGDNKLTQLLSSPTLMLLGGASYALYILQGPIREWMRLLLPKPMDSILNPFVLVVVSILVFYFVEEPARKGIQRIYKWAEGSSIGVA